MRYCENCRVRIRTPQKHCPLCQGALSGDGSGCEQLFPDLSEETSKLAFWFKIYTFVCVLAAVVCVSLNAALPFDTWWSLFVLAGVACAWLVTVVAIRKRRNLLKNAMWQLVLACIALVLWDWATGWQLWALDYGLPAAVVAALVSMLVIITVRKMSSPEYMIYLLMCCGFGLIPLVLLVCGALKVQWPSIVSSACCVIVLAAFGIFQGGSVWSELKKSLHL